MVTVILYRILKQSSNDELFQMVQGRATILSETGKIMNPWPFVYTHSGDLLQYYGMKEMNYTLLFDVSRTFGSWSRYIYL